MTSPSARPAQRAEPSDDDSRSDEDGAYTRAEIFHLLQTNRRRDVIEYLLDEDGPVKMGTLAEHVAALEHDTTVAELTSRQRQRVYVPLYQTHLPKLDEKGVIEYDKRRGIVRATDRVEYFRPYLERRDGADRSGVGSGGSLVGRVLGDYYAVATCVSAGLLVAVATGTVRLTGLILAGIIVSLFALATAAATVSKAVASDETDARSRR